MNDTEAVQFARGHVETWNSHDLDAIVELYADSVEIVSPLAASILGNAHVRGKESLREYFAAGLEKYPDLRFDIVNTFRCESSVTIVYHGARGGLVAEVMFLAADRKIERVYAHYVCVPSDKSAN